jgi:hypothetical protein
MECWNIGFFKIRHCSFTPAEIFSGTCQYLWQPGGADFCVEQIKSGLPDILLGDIEQPLLAILSAPAVRMAEVS